MKFQDKKILIFANKLIAEVQKAGHDTHSFDSDSVHVFKESDGRIKVYAPTVMGPIAQGRLGGGQAD